MPKPSNNKKRKREKKKDEERGTKKAKSKDDGEGVEKADEDKLLNLNDLNEHESELHGQKEEEFDDIDEILEENAARINLTAINVKSILHVS